MLWIKAFHIISMVAWFAGLFYLPRLFVYHAKAEDRVGQERFKVMERRLYYGIMMPSAILTVGTGIWLLSYNFSGYLQAGWMHVKLGLVGLLICFHFYCGYLRKCFQNDQNRHTETFYRYLNEFPTLILIAVVLLVIVKP